MSNQLFIIISLLSLSLISCKTEREKKDNPQQETNEKLQATIKTSTAILSDQDKELTLAGKVISDPERTISYTALLNGVIDRAYFSLGDKVQKGQTLLDIRSTELSGLQAEKMALETELRVAERELKTAESLFSDEMIAEQEYLEAIARVKQAKTSIEKVNTDISVFGQQKANGTISIQAPLSGYVIAKNASSGTTVTEASDPLFTIADLQQVWIMVNIYAGNLQFAKEGMEVEITSLSYPNEVFKAKINSIPQVFDPEEKVIKARVIMENKDLKFKPEMSVVVKLKSNDHGKCISIPSQALIFDDNRYFVVVAESEGKFSNRLVELQGHHDQTSYIASGLKEGEKVVINNQLLIYSGQKGV